MATPVFGVIPSGAQPEPAGYATIIPDAITSLEPIDIFVTGWSSPVHTLESQAGTERLEDGSEITDHVSALPAKLTLTGWVSNLSQDGNAPAEAWEAVRNLQRKEEVFRVVTEWGVYDEAFIAGATTTQTGRGMKFTIDLQEVVRVGLQPGDTTNVRRDVAKVGERGDDVNQGRVRIPGVDQGDGVFLTGLPGDQNRRMLQQNPDGTFTILPADGTGQ